MGGIANEHVEWAVVDRLSKMFNNPPKTEFNVTQSFALFSTVLLWTKNRAWIAGNHGQRGDWSNQVDHRAHDVREMLRSRMIVDEPWSLSIEAPIIALANIDYEENLEDRQINSDFKDMTAERFFQWLRNALAHGDGRSITPIHKPSKRWDKTLLVGFRLLAGFRIVSPRARRSPQRLTLDLHSADMRRIGSKLADLFCKSLAGDDRHLEREAGRVLVEEVRNVA